MQRTLVSRELPVLEGVSSKGSNSYLGKGMEETLNFRSLNFSSIKLHSPPFCSNLCILVKIIPMKMHQLFSLDFSE